ncbi:hypothetical protein D3C84_1029150 [compost metagenome]
MLGCIIGTPHNAGAEKQAFYVITAVKLHGQVRELLWRECSPACLVGFTVHAISAVVYASVGHQHLKQRDAASICGEAVADSHADRIAHATGLTFALGTAGGAGDIIFGRSR